MHTQYDGIGESGLQFFGKVSASISHELKNVLAIINENAGLLEDLSFAAKRGSAIDPERLDRTVQNFQKQIHRADEILKNMSRFAHSVDSFAAQVNLHELTVLVAHLATRPAAMRKVSLETVPPPAPISLSTNPFLLENLLWFCLEMAISATTAGGTLTLTPGQSGAVPCLHIAGIDRLAESYPATMPAGHAELLTALDARLTADTATNTLTLHLA